MLYEVITPPAPCQQTTGLQHAAIQPVCTDSRTRKEITQVEQYPAGLKHERTDAAPLLRAEYSHQGQVRGS